LGGRAIQGEEGQGGKILFNEIFGEGKRKWTLERERETEREKVLKHEEISPKFIFNFVIEREKRFCRISSIEGSYC
jgi:hypothetical protein